MTTWTLTKPTTPGAYWVRNFEIGSCSGKALVELRKWRGSMICNLHETNSSRDYEHWFFVSNLNPKMRWCGPLSTGDEA